VGVRLGGEKAKKREKGIMKEKERKDRKRKQESRKEIKRKK